jgi:hypothetical protein
MRLLTLVVGLLFYMFAAAQPEQTITSLPSGSLKLAADPTGHLFLASRTAEISVADSIGAEWFPRPVIPKSRMNIRYSHLYDNINFFNRDTGLVSGFCTNDNTNYDVLFRTVNGGQTWDTIHFGQSGWIDQAVNLDNGEAWLSVAGSGIAYSNDFGSSWKKIPIPDTHQRYTSIFFNAAHEGFMGSLWNSLLLTRDNGSTWTSIPTPLDQHKYTKTYKDRRPEINKVAIYKTYFFVTQEESVFYTERDSIDWQPWSSVVDFDTDPENTTLVVKTPKYEIQFLDSLLRPVAAFNTPGHAASCVKNNHVYLISDESVTQAVLQPNLTLKVTTIKHSIPRSFGSTMTGTLGNLNNNIYTNVYPDNVWHFSFQLPFNVTDSTILSMPNITTIAAITRGNDTIYSYDMSTRTSATVTQTEWSRNFVKAGIATVTFAAGSAGCFHNYSDRLSFINDDGTFTAGEVSSSKMEHKVALVETDVSIDSGVINRFLRNILEHPTALPKLEDMHLSPADYQQCRADILAFRRFTERPSKRAQTPDFFLNQNDIDFDSLLACVDKVQYLTPQQLEQALALQQSGFSTTTNSVGISFINKKDERLDITYISFMNHAFLPTCRISKAGTNYVSNDLRVYDFVQKTYPELFAPKERVKLLEMIVKWVYMTNQSSGFSY